MKAYVRNLFPERRSAKVSALSFMGPWVLIWGKSDGKEIQEAEIASVIVLKLELEPWD
jgi:hypothetical protein